jgi:hypothetical protein
MAEQEKQLVITKQLSAIVLRNETFRTLEDLKVFIKSQEPQDQCYLQVNAATQILEMKDQWATNLVEFYEWVKNDEAYKLAVVGKEHFKELTAEIADEVAAIKRSATEIRAVSIANVVKLCVGERGTVLKRYFEIWAQSTERRYGKNFFYKWAQLLKTATSIQVAIEAVNWKIWERIKAAKGGKGTDPKVKAADVEKAIMQLDAEKDLQGLKWVDIPEGQMWGNSLRWGAVGLLEAQNRDRLDIRKRRDFSDEEGLGSNLEEIVEPGIQIAQGILATRVDDEGIPIGEEIWEVSSTPATSETARPGSILASPVLDVPMSEGEPSEAPTPIDLTGTEPTFETPEAPKADDSDSSSELSSLSSMLSEQVEKLRIPDTTRQIKKPITQKGRQKKKGKAKSLGDPECQCSKKAHSHRFGELDFSDVNAVMDIAKKVASSNGEFMPCLHHCKKIGKGLGLKELKTQEQYFNTFYELQVQWARRDRIGEVVNQAEVWDRFDPTDERIRWIREATMNGALRYPAIKKGPDFASLPEMPEKGMGLRLNWFNETRDGINLAYLFEQELDMYLHYFHVQAGKHIRFTTQ